MSTPSYLSPVNTRMYLFLMILTISVWAGFQGWRTLFNNFAVEVAALEGHQVGFIQSVREIPGFLALGVIVLLLVFKEHHLAAVGVITLGIGVAMAGFLPSYAGLMLTTLVMSFGFHYFETLNQSMTLQFFDIHQAPLVFGRLRSVGAATSIVAGLGILLASQWASYWFMFLILGAVAAAGGLWCLFMHPNTSGAPVQHKKMIFRQRYWLFYLLTFLAGARRQIFIAFAVFLLVKKFGFTIQAVTFLFVLNQSVNFFVNPLIGRAINRFGERSVLSVEYLVLIMVFLCYAFAESKTLVAAMYILDHLVFNCAMAIRTFFQKIADPRDIAPSMAMGFTINHIAAVVLPFLGGLLWLVDYRLVFASGVILCLGSLAMVQVIPSQLAAARVSSGQ